MGVTLSVNDRCLVYFNSWLLLQLLQVTETLLKVLDIPKYKTLSSYWRISIPSVVTMGK